MKINIVKRKMIKPCIPTPQNLKNFKISFIDEIAPSMNIAVILFYPSKPEGFIHKLEESLRKILPQFYVLAGRYIKTDYSVSCSDEGAEFVEAEAAIDDDNGFTGATEQLNDLLPRRPYRVDAATDPLLSVQITDLTVGGLAIGISLSHRVADASTLATFVATWSATATGNVPVADANFDEFPALFPGGSRGNPHGERSRIEGPGMECKTLFFNEEALDDLRSRLRCSKVVAASAVVAKALISLDRAKQGRLRDCYINQAVNMRGRTVPPLGPHACGNLVLQSVSLCRPDDDDAGSLHHLGDLMGRAVRESVSDCAGMMCNDVIMKPMDDSLPRMFRGEAYGVWFTDWSKFGFYEADFGWGKPVRTSIGPMNPDLTVLMETRDGKGIEAWVHLRDEDMRLFEQDEDIRLLAN